MGIDDDKEAQPGENLEPEIRSIESNSSLERAQVDLNGIRSVFFDGLAGLIRQAPPEGLLIPPVSAEKLTFAQEIAKKYHEGGFASDTEVTRFFIALGLKDIRFEVSDTNTHNPQAKKITAHYKLPEGLEGTLSYTFPDESENPSF